MKAPRKPRVVACGICGTDVETLANSPVTFCPPCRKRRETEVREASRAKAKDRGGRLKGEQGVFVVPCLRCGVDVKTRNTAHRACCSACKSATNKERDRKKAARRAEMALTARPCAHPGCAKSAMPSSLRCLCWGHHREATLIRKNEIAPKACCGECYDLAHRRPATGCPTCGGAFKELTVSIKAQASSGCALAWV